MAGQVDRYGNPIITDPYNTVQTTEGVPLPQQPALILVNCDLSDSPDQRATIIRPVTTVDAGADLAILENGERSDGALAYVKLRGAGYTESTGTGWDSETTATELAFQDDSRDPVQVWSRTDRPDLQFKSHLDWYVGTALSRSTAGLTCTGLAADSACKDGEMLANLCANTDRDILSLTRIHLDSPYTSNGADGDFGGAAMFEAAEGEVIGPALICAADTGGVVVAIADSTGRAKVVGVSVNSADATEERAGIVLRSSGNALCTWDSAGSAPTVGDVVYLSDNVPGMVNLTAGTDSVRIGRVVEAQGVELTVALDGGDAGGGAFDGNLDGNLRVTGSARVIAGPLYLSEPSETATIAVGTEGDETTTMTFQPNGASGVRVHRRLVQRQGADGFIETDGSMTLASGFSGGNSHLVTIGDSATLRKLQDGGALVGTQVCLILEAGITIVHNDSSGATGRPILLASGADVTTPVGLKVVMPIVLDDTEVWREIGGLSRTL